MRINAEEAYKIAKTKQPERSNAKRILSIIERQIEEEANRGSFSTYFYISKARVDIEYIISILRFDDYKVTINDSDTAMSIFIEWKLK